MWGHWCSGTSQTHWSCDPAHYLMMNALRNKDFLLSTSVSAPWTGLDSPLMNIFHPFSSLFALNFFPSCKSQMFLTWLYTVSKQLLSITLSFRKKSHFLQFSPISSNCSEADVCLLLRQLVWSIPSYPDCLFMCLGYQGKNHINPCWVPRSWFVCFQVETQLTHLQESNTK